MSGLRIWQRFKITPALSCIDKAAPDYCVDRDSVRHAFQFPLTQPDSFLNKHLVVNKLSPEKTYASGKKFVHLFEHVFTTLSILNIAILNIKKREVELWPN